MNRLVVCVVLAVCATAAAGYQASLTGSGARAMGMGGAFIAVADDATAISWNPAGLTRLDMPELGAAVTFGSGSWDLSLGDAFVEDFDLDIEIDSKLTLNFASAVYPLKLGERHAVAAVAYRRYWDFTQKTTQTFAYTDDIMVDVDQDGYWDGYTDREKYVNDIAGAVAAVTPAFAVQLSPMLSVGATASVMMGGRSATSEYSVNYHDDFGYEDTYIEETESTNGYSGFTAELGLLADLSPRFKVGAVASLPWTLTIKDNEIDGVPAGEDADQKLPAVFGAGLALKPAQQMTVAFDVRQHAWSKVEYNGEEQNWPDATVLRGGVEYILIGQSAVIPLRAGYFIEPLPEKEITGYDEFTGELIYGDQLKNKAFTLGAGLLMGRITLDACFTRTTLTYDDNYGENTLTDNAFTISTVVHLGPSEE